MNKIKKSIIWDLDGTLMDTLQDLHEAVNHALTSCQMPPRTLEQTRSAVGNGVRTLMKLSVPDGEGNPQFEQVFDAFKQYYLIHCQDHTDLYPGIADLLKELKQRGVRMAVVSNKLQSGVDELYEVWFKDTIEIAIGERPEMSRKPAPDMVNLAISQMGIEKKDAIYIGDSDVDIATARNSNLPCISVLWGFRDREFLTEHGAMVFAERPEDILGIIDTMDKEQNS